jgi:5,5'-dehydrodivanillate O-demethylase
MYHGWKYDATGQCIEQPAEDPAYACKIRIRGCPTREYLGLIFAYFGEGKPPPLPRYPNFEKEGILEASPPASRGCNYFQCLENHGDVVHVPFVHRESHLLGDARAGIPTLVARQSEWGWTSDVVFPGGEKHVYQFGMPNMHELRLPTSDPAAPWEDRLIVRVPTDDDHSVRFSVSLVPLIGEAGQRYKERRAALRLKGGPSVDELGDAALAGKVRIQDLPKLAKKNILVNTQDYIAQVGQGSITDRAREHLGRSDVGVILLRKMWRKELEALAKGRPLKRWHHPANLEVVYEKGNSPVVGH